MKQSVNTVIAIRVFISYSSILKLITIISLILFLSSNEFLDDDQETEWQHYLRASIETVLRISDVLPEDVLRIVVR